MSSIRESLRWTLLFWYATLLAAVVAAFGWILYTRSSHAMLEHVDTLLEARADATLERTDWDAAGGLEVDPPDADWSQSRVQVWAAIFDEAGRVVWSEGAVSPPAAAVSPGFHSAGDERLYVESGPKALRVVVGASIAAERAALGRLLGWTIASGILFVAVAVLGGYWLTSRALRPIERIAETARRLSERDLSARIEGQDIPVELRGLTQTLNGAFERLQQAFARQARFTADASHELRTPLSVIRAQAEVALARERDVAEYRSALESCLRSARRMSGTVEALLALARGESNGVELGRETVMLDEVARTAVSDALPRATIAGISLDCDARPVPVRGDAGLLGDVADNLLENAIRYNRRGGKVRVGVRATDTTATLTVEDDGIGIPDEALERVFERFYRVDPARSRESGGSGLGLAIARDIVVAHGGSIRVESRLGIGSSFVVELPLS